MIRVPTKHDLLFINMLINSSINCWIYEMWRKLPSQLPVAQIIVFSNQQFKTVIYSNYI